MPKTPRFKMLWWVAIVIGATAGYIAIINSPLGFILRSNPLAGRWEDDSMNWYRAFGEAPPADVSVVHSYYWKSGHFTHEYIYFFEVQASPEWQQAFLKKRTLKRVAKSDAWSFRFSIDYEWTPDWFAPDPVEQYDVYDLPGYHGKVWVNKTNGHMHFYGVQL